MDNKKLNNVDENVWTKKYSQIMDLRREGVRKYGLLMYNSHPPARIILPTLAVSQQRKIAANELPHVFMWPGINVVDNPDVWNLSLKYINPGSKVLDIGCSQALFYKYLQFNRIPVIYHGLDIDETVVIPNPLFRSIEEVIDAGEKYNVITMFEVIEHLTREQFVHYLNGIVPVIEPTGTLLVSTPNIFCYPVFHRDAGHIQFYPWYDLYALLRIFFKEVIIIRSFYLCTLERLISLPARILLAFLQETDWCTGILAIAKHSRNLGASLTQAKHDYWSSAWEKDK